LRRLEALVALDVYNSTAQMARNEMVFLDRLAGIQQRIIAECLPLYRGQIIRRAGDSMHIVFASVVDAVEWILAFQGEREAERAADGNAPRFRAAVVLADLIVDGDNRHGAPIFMASALQEKAPVGGIVITHSVRYQLTGPLIEQFPVLRTVTIEGAPYPVETWSTGLPVP
jgi:adenylate cyclase